MRVENPLHKSNLKRPTCASNQDGLALATIRYVFRTYLVTISKALVMTINGVAKFEIAKNAI